MNIKALILAFVYNIKRTFDISAEKKKGYLTLQCLTSLIPIIKY